MCDACWADQPARRRERQRQAMIVKRADSAFRARDRIERNERMRRLRAARRRKDRGGGGGGADEQTSSPRIALPFLSTNGAGQRLATLHQQITAQQRVVSQLAAALEWCETRERFAET